MENRRSLNPKWHLRIYENHYPVLDIDVGHPQHYGSTSGFVHVFDFTKGQDWFLQRGRGHSMTESEEEYCWDGYDEMLSAAISQTGKTVSAMLTELPDHDLEIAINVSGKI